VQSERSNDLVRAAVIIYCLLEQNELITNIFVAQVYNIQHVRTAKKGSYPKFPDRDNHWAEAYEWSLYSGTIITKSGEQTVHGWSFTSALPLLWGCDYVEWRPVGDLGAFSWLDREDDIENELFFGPYDQDAARKIRDMLGQEELDEYLATA
jgi:hypothetical protein